MGSPAPEGVQRSRGGGEESSRTEEREEDSDGPVQHAAGQRAAGIVSTAHTHSLTIEAVVSICILGAGD